MDRYCQETVKQVNGHSGTLSQGLLLAVLDRFSLCRGGNVMSSVVIVQLILFYTVEE